MTLQEAMILQAELDVAAPRIPHSTRELPSVFQQEWWLDAATAGTWEQVEGGDRSGAHAILPFMRERRYGAVRLVLPPYTRTLGPSFSLPPSKGVTRLATMRSLTRELIERLPRCGLFRQVLPPEAQDEALAFSFNQWKVETEYTFRIPATTPRREAWEAMSQKTRNLIRTSQHRFEVEWHMDIGRFMALSRAQLGAKGESDLHRYADMARIFEAAQARDQAIIASALDGCRRDAAAVVLVWDSKVLYLWNTARDLAASGSGGLCLLVWSACEFARARGLTMDFDGFATPAAGHFIASFGGIPVPRPVIMHKGAWCSTLSVARSLASQLQARRRGALTISGRQRADA